MIKIEIDVRELEPPEPLQRVLEVSSSLPKDHYIKMIHRREPVLLFPILKKQHLQYSIEEIDEIFNIYIWHEGIEQPPKDS